MNYDMMVKDKYCQKLYPTITANGTTIFMFGSILLVYSVTIRKMTPFNKLSANFN